MSEQVQVREGVWRTRDGEEVEVRARDTTGLETEWRWEGMRRGHIRTWRDDGTIHIEREQKEGDLMQFLRPLPDVEPEPAPEPTPEQHPVQIREGVWRTRDGRQMQVRESTDWRLPSHPWTAKFDGEQYIWMRHGRFHAEADSPADLVAYLRPLPAQTTTDTLVEIEQQAAEDLQQWMEATALQRRRLEAELSAMTADRDRLQREHQAMTEHARELLESAQQARDERDLLAQRLVTKPSEEALQKENSRKQIEINTLKDQLTDRTSERDELASELQAMTEHCRRQHEQIRALQAELDAAGQQPAPADKSEQIERIWDESRERAVSEIIELLIPLQVATGTHAEAVLQILPAVIRRWMDNGGCDDVE